jgi:polar amino acid transport system ATP-binding protein
MAILQVKDIEKKFGHVEILKGISFDMERGQTVSILGSSGSGKTTLLRCLNFLEIPDGGEIIVNGNTLFDAATKELSENELNKRRLHFGMVFQQFNLFPQYTALENVTLAPGLLDKSRDAGEIEEEGKRLLEKMGLSDRMNNYPHQLSGGQQQRVAIARALALKPDILCFDEPTSALDPELTGEVLKVIKELADQHTTMIIVTHEIDFARNVSDEIIFMDGGVIVERGTPEQVIDKPENERTRQFLSSIHRQA